VTIPVEKELQWAGMKFEIADEALIWVDDVFVGMIHQFSHFFLELG
jgi:hypothetical protein